MLSRRAFFLDGFSMEGDFFSDLSTAGAGVALAGAVAFGVLAYGTVGLLGRAGWAGHLAGALISAVVGGYLLLRFGLAAPIAFVERKIDFVRAWRLTRAHVPALLGMWVLNACLFMLVWVVLYLVIFLSSGLLFGFHGFGPIEGGDALISHPGQYLLEGVVPILAAPALLVVSQAPWVAAYQAFSKDAAGS
jgi:hypothetical protein